MNKKEVKTKEFNSIDEVICAIKYEVITSELKKSGHNDSAKKNDPTKKGFDYFELKDFLPSITKAMYKYGANDSISVEEAENGNLWAVYSLYWKDQSRSIRLPYHEYKVPSFVGYDKYSQKEKTTYLMSDIQWFGSTITYYRRYLAATFWNICESDLIDSLEINSEKTKDSKIKNYKTEKKERTPEELARKLDKEDIDFLIKNGYTGNTSNLTVADGVKIAEELRNSKEQTKSDPEPASDRQKAQLNQYIRDKKWSGDPNTLTFQEASDIIQSIIFKGQKEE